MAQLSNVDGVWTVSITSTATGKQFANSTFTTFDEALKAFNQYLRLPEIYCDVRIGRLRIVGTQAYFREYDVSADF